MKASNQLYVEVLPGETIRAFIRRYEDKAGNSPHSLTMLKCWHPRPIIECDVLHWQDIHDWLSVNVDKDDYTWYGNVFFFTHADQAAIFRLLFG
jgi:hypothetical protein